MFNTMFVPIDCDRIDRKVARFNAMFVSLDRDRVSIGHQQRLGDCRPWWPARQSAYNLHGVYLNKLTTLEIILV